MDIKKDQGFGRVVQEVAAGQGLNTRATQESVWEWGWGLRAFLGRGKSFREVGIGRVRWDFDLEMAVRNYHVSRSCYYSGTHFLCNNVS